MTTYKDAGVDLRMGDIASKFAGDQCKKTFYNCPAIQVIDPSEGYFRGNRYVVRQPGFESFGSNTSVDGNGSKPVLSDAAGMHRKTGFDLVAMTAMDGVRRGELPTTLGVDLSVATLGEDVDDPVYKAVCEIIAGTADAVSEIGAVYFTGETAEIKRIIKSDNPDALVRYNLTGAMESLVDPDKMITGNSLKSGQIIMAMRENGYRSNGGSLIIKVGKDYFGEDFYSNPDAAEYVKASAEPSVLYEKFFCYINGWLHAPEEDLIQVHTLSHISGGSFANKLGQDLLFPRGFSAHLTDLWGLPRCVKLCADLGDLTDRTIYETFCAGNGVLAVIDRDDEQKFIRIASEIFGLEAKYAGEIVQSDRPHVEIHSKYKGEVLTFE